MPLVPSFPHRATAPVSPGASIRRRRFLPLFSLAAFAGPLHAMGLGEVVQQSALGAPLRIVVPVIAGPNDELSGECFKLTSSQRGGDGIPEVLNARVTLERAGPATRLVITAPRSVNDPVVKLTVQAGCSSPIRREYTLLMDPAPIDVPVVADATTPRADAGVRTAPLAPPAAISSSGSAGTGVPATATEAPPPPQRPASRRRSAPASAPRPDAAAPQAAPAPRPAQRTARKAAPASPPAAAATTRPKLSVSSAPPAIAAPAKTIAEPTKTDAEKSAAAAAVNQDAARTPPGTVARPEGAEAIDAETAALRKRVEELTAMVDKMQQEMRASEALAAAQAARLAAETSARATPQAALHRWWNEGWPLLAAVIGMAALIAAALTWKRARAAGDTPPWRAEPTPPARTEPGRDAGPATGGGVAAAPIAASPAAAALTRTSNTISPPPTVSEVDVSELSHVTEEAGVYLAFNRVDRAIEVLQEHIRAKPRSIPAAWLMLLDLYRTQGREQEFRKLAAEFHTRFNAETPDWENYSRHDQSEHGLEAFPHLIRSLTAMWGKPECRTFLEHLLHENRDGRRNGFSLAAYEDILFLRQLMDLAAPEAPTAAGRDAPRATPSAAAVVRAKRPVTLDLELALDNDMLEAARAQSTRDKPKG